MIADIEEISNETRQECRLVTWILSLGKMDHDALEACRNYFAIIPREPITMVARRFGVAVRAEVRRRARLESD